MGTRQKLGILGKQAENFNKLFQSWTPCNESSKFLTTITKFQIFHNSKFRFQGITPRITTISLDIGKTQGLAVENIVDNLTINNHFESRFSILPNFHIEFLSNSWSSDCTFTLVTTNGRANGQKTRFVKPNCWHAISVRIIIEIFREMKQTHPFGV